MLWVFSNVFFPPKKRSGLKYLVCLNYFNRSVNFKNFKNDYRIRIFFVYVHV